MAGTLKIYKLESMGVNVDSDPLSLADQELRQAQNAIRDPMSADGLRKRPGLGVFATGAAGVILGGQGVPLANASGNGTQLLYIGRTVIQS